MKFEWDDKKAKNNLQKHSVSFEEARSVFTSFLSVDFPDEEHSESEERWLKLGPSNGNRLLIISYVERGEHIRVISARAATKREIKAYEERKPRE
ncbi:MAG: BrnT family toxin [Calditrichaeota bacterium]|nr:BrnT family toxin [Calditrichota bacterium]